MKIVAVTDRMQCQCPLIEQIDLIAVSGADMVVLREKDLSIDDYRDLAIQAKEVCDGYGTGFCVNTFSDIADAIGAENVWIPYRDLVEKGRPDISNVGVSVHSEEEAFDAADRGADFIIYGNVFETTCKPGKEAKGFDELRRICAGSYVPVYAIGGITVSNMEQVCNCGVEGVCIMSGFMKADEPSEIVARAHDLLE